uniref:Metalloendopeptidase n=1 Tax=Parasteatoda tepidariorum TaxID=114398 RepID=A0A2L2Z3T2_PARTP
MKTCLFLAGLLAVSLAEIIQLIAQHQIEARLAMLTPDLYDGDMAGIDGPFDSERYAIVGNHYRWPNARVPRVTSSHSHPILQKRTHTWGGLK